ncbi:MAG: hypothetical protein ACLVEU_15525 [Bacteroides cellulosilyticus]
MKTKKNLLLLLLLLVLPFTLQAETFNVKKYGARGNGKKDGLTCHSESN